MIDIGNLLDACGISYTEKQLVKLDKLVNELFKRLSIQQFDSNATIKDKPIQDSTDKLENKDVAHNTEMKPFQHCSPEIDIKHEFQINNTIKEEVVEEIHCIPEFEFETEPNYDNTIKEEILEESEREIQKQFPKDPFASLDTFNNSEDVREITNENYNLNPEKTVNKNNICSICDKRFLRKAELKRHKDSVHEGKKPHKCSICVL